MTSAAPLTLAGTIPHVSRSRLRMVVEVVGTSATWRTIVWWYFAMLLLAVVAKYETSGWGDILRMSPDAGGALEGWLLGTIARVSRIFRVYRSDILQTAAIVAAPSSILCVVPRLRVTAMAWTTTSLGALIVIVEWLAFRQTGVPLTYDNLVISLDWAREHPEVISRVASWPALALTPCAIILYGTLPIIAGGERRHPRMQRLVSNASRMLSVSAAILLTAAVATPGTTRYAFSRTLSPTEGFWSSSAASLAAFDGESPANLPMLSRADLMQQYWQIAYPLGRAPTPALLDASIGPIAPRHVILIVLETAPYAYYRITDDPSYRTFHTMTEDALVSEHHFTTRPYTLFAIYSMLTGTYPRPGAPIGGYGHFRNHGLASTLAARGYETTYIDSYRVDWGYRYRAELEDQGFAAILDADAYQGPASADEFTTSVDRERWSFAQALDRVATASAHKRHAFVTVATTLGHFPWRAPPTMGNAASSDRMRAMAMTLDTLTGSLLHELDALHLRDSTIVIVTGDHGLRYTAEYQSLALTTRSEDVDFKVPFLLHAPGLLRKRVDIPYATSHVDIAPTVYYLLGIPSDSMLLHGENMLDTRLADRATFLMNTGLYPVDGFTLRGRRFTSNRITGASRVTPALSAAERSRYGSVDTQIGSRLDSANHLFNLTAAHFIGLANGKKPLEHTR